MSDYVSANQEEHEVTYWVPASDDTSARRHGRIISGRMAREFAESIVAAVAKTTPHDDLRDRYERALAIMRGEEGAGDE